MKYSLRSLMIVMLIAAICAAWLADHRRLAEENWRLVKEVKRLAYENERLPMSPVDLPFNPFGRSGWPRPDNSGAVP